jgi:hypothetical protein
MALEIVKKGKHYRILKEGENLYVLLEKVRISFPAIGHVREQEQEDGTISKKYECTAMVPKATHDEAFKALLSVMNGIMTDNKVKIATEYKCVKDGDAGEREEYHDHWVVAMSDAKRPVARNESGNLMFDPKKVRDAADVEAVLETIDETFFAGAICDVLCRLWYFNGQAKGKKKTYPKRICGSITAIKFVEDDGTRFAGAGQIDTAGLWDEKDDDSSDALGDEDGGL